MLPSGAGGMEQFYQQVFRRLREKFARDRLVDANSTTADVFRVLVGAETWPEAFRRQRRASRPSTPSPSCGRR